MEMCSEEAARYVWEGSIPLQIHLHESEITTLPPPPPALVLGPRLGYLPLLVPLIKPHFKSTLPLGVDTVWFEYKGLPLKWCEEFLIEYVFFNFFYFLCDTNAYTIRYMPIGVLFDLLCAEPERPWNLTVHFRGYPSEVLMPCEGEDNIKWSYINSLKEAAYIINGNCKNIMNMSQADQLDLWQSLVKGNMDDFVRISSKLKLGPVGDDSTAKGLPSAQTRQVVDEPDFVGSTRTCRIPVRLYIRDVGNNVNDFDEVSIINSWDAISYVNRAIDVQKYGGYYMTLKHAMTILLPEIFTEPLIDIREFRSDDDCDEASSGAGRSEAETATESVAGDETSTNKQSKKAILIRIQGIEPDADIPFFWIVNNLKNPEYFLHICVFIHKIKPT